MEYKTQLEQLKEVQKQIKSGSYDTEAVSESLEEITEAIRHTEVRFFVSYTNENNKAHIETYQNKGRQRKHRAIVKLVELKHLISKKHTNLKRVNVLLNQLIDSNFHKKDTEKILSWWKSVNAKQFQQAFFKI